MISGVNTVALVLQKEKKEILSPRVLELRAKIQDKEYIDNAVQRIAQVISRKLIEEPDDDTLFRD
ncbi:MAG TPA: hypothetical protein DCL73_00350 [Treponema sp.]|nr:hypothetical protein [Treponema sp.]